MAASQAPSTKIQLTLTAPPAAQFEKGAMLNVYADQEDELFSLVNSFFGKDVTEDLRSMFDTGRAVSIVKAQLAGEEVPTPAAPKPQKGSADTESLGTCPESGHALVRKSGVSKNTGKPYNFVSCSGFPACKYSVK